MNAQEMMNILIETFESRYDQVANSDVILMGLLKKYSQDISTHFKECCKIKDPNGAEIKFRNDFIDLNIVRSSDDVDWIIWTCIYHSITFAGAFQQAFRQVNEAVSGLKTFGVWPAGESTEPRQYVASDPINAVQQFAEEHESSESGEVFSVNVRTDRGVEIYFFQKSWVMKTDVWSYEEEVEHELRFGRNGLAG